MLLICCYNCSTHQYNPQTPEVASLCVAMVTSSSEDLRSSIAQCEAGGGQGRVVSSKNTSKPKVNNFDRRIFRS